MILLLKHFTLLTIWYCGPWSFCGNYSGVHPKNIWLCTGKAKWRECEGIFRRCLSLINLLLYGNNIPGGLPSYLWELQLFFLHSSMSQFWEGASERNFNNGGTVEMGKSFAKNYRSQYLPNLLVNLSHVIATTPSHIWPPPLTHSFHHIYRVSITTPNPLYTILTWPCMAMHGCITFIPRSCSSCAHLIPSLFMPIVMPIISHSSSTLLTHMGLMPTHFSL